MEFRTQVGPVTSDYRHRQTGFPHAVGQQTCCHATVDSFSPKKSPVVRPPLQLGNTALDVPLLLAPMAGYTSYPMRKLCAQYGAEMCTSEMIIASTLISRTRRALALARFGPDESIRSAQLYGIDPSRVHDAAFILAREFGVHHIDLNFGCPVRKVTARGGGAALPVRFGLVGRLVAAAKEGASRGSRLGGGGGDGGDGQDIPAVTVKMRLGLTPDLLTFQEASAAAQAAGAAAITLHARTADQLYSPPCYWNAIGELTRSLSIPVIGNGDIFTGADATAMIEQTGCAGVMVGRAALGRPWVFREIRAALTGGDESPLPPPPVRLQEAVEVATTHLEGLVAWEEEGGSERREVLKMRSLVPLYLLGFASANKGLRQRLQACTSLAEWHTAVGVLDWDRDELADPTSFRHPRLKGGTYGQRQKVSLPPLWLDGWGSDSTIDGGTDEACEG